MRARRSVKGNQAPQIVAVISSPADLRRALRLRRPPDFFELRLDALWPVSDEIEKLIGKLSVPLIVTARHPREGGMNNLSLGQRRRLLVRFLPHAAWVDVELRSAGPLRPILEAARHRRIKRIISVHELEGTPAARHLEKLAHAARALCPEVFKVVTRTDTAVELARLLEFFEAHKARLSISVMAVGKLGRLSRACLPRRGSVLNYVHLGAAQAEGQLSLAELRRRLGRASITNTRRGRGRNPERDESNYCSSR